MLRILRNIISDINYLAFLVLLFMLPYGMQTIKICWIIWIVSWIFELRFLKRPQINLHTLFFFSGLAVWFLWNLLSVSWADNKDISWDTIGRQVNLICLLPLIVWGVNDKYDLRTCMKVIILTALISSFTYLFAHYWVYNSQHAFNKFAPATYHFNFLRMDDMLLEMKHRMHYSNLLCLAGIAIPALYPQLAARRGKTVAIILSCLTLLWFGAVIYWTGSRIGLIILFALAGLAGLLKLKGWKRYVSAVAVILLLLGFFFSMCYWHPRYKDINPQEWLRYNPESINPGNEARLAIWNTIWENRQEYPAYGLGAGNAQPFLQKKYEERNWIDYIQRRFNAHNQFFTTWMELGVIAAILFIALWCYMPFCFSPRTRHLALYTDIILFLSMMVENLLSGLEGIIFTGIVLFLLTLSERQTAEA